MNHTQRVRKLYKTILRLHRGLPLEIQPLGNEYARSEFKSHKQCSKEQTDLFMTEWTKYAVNLAQQLGLRGKSEKPLGEHLDDNKLEHLRDEQVAQLYELLLAAKGMDENDRKILDNVDK